MSAGSVLAGQPARGPREVGLRVLRAAQARRFGLGGVEAAEPDADLGARLFPLAPLPTPHAVFLDMAAVVQA